MLLRLCQLKSPMLLALPLIILSSCSWLVTDPKSATEVVTTFPNKWFNANENHSLAEPVRGVLPHLFFDASPEFSKLDQTINAVILTSEGSPHAYSLDLGSGQRYYNHSYCKQKDVWNNFSGTLDRPSYFIGFIPRFLDQLGDPQKVIIWSKRKQFSETAFSNVQRVRLVGGYIEQLCLEGNCLGKKNWPSRLVFLAVDDEDKTFSSIKKIDELSSKIGWETVRASLENLEGRNWIGDNNYPAKKVNDLIEYEDVIDFFQKRSIYLTDVETKKIQKNCHKLYDLLWEKVGKKQPQDFPAKTIEELNERIRVRQDLGRKSPMNFAERFQAFTSKYFKEISTCEKFVYHGNINKDREKFWFLAYAGIFYKLHKEGYYFDCKNKLWQRNSLNSEGHLTYDLKKEIGECKGEDLDYAMSYLPNFLNGLKAEDEFYKFIEYDNEAYGTHNKIYSWVKINSKRLQCENNPNDQIIKNSKVLPEDIKWESRKVKDLADQMKIIY